MTFLTLCFLVLISLQILILFQTVLTVAFVTVTATRAVSATNKISFGGKTGANQGCSHRYTTTCKMSHVPCQWHHCRMLKIPIDTLALLKCSKCECYLSHSPVYRTPDGLALCPSCYTPECLAVQDTVYEAVAKLLLFPCKNAGFGCKETVPFAEQEQETTHEEECKYRQIVCPLLGPTHCDWFASQVNLLRHCAQQHKDKVLCNPITLSHNITQASNEKYLVQAFDKLFLLEVQVSLTSGKINYEMRFLGRIDERNQYKFSLLIKRRNEKLEKECSMALQDRAIQASLAFNISSMLDVLGGWDDTPFTVTLQQTGNPLKMLRCLRCHREGAELCLGNTGFCQVCVSKKITCKYHGCEQTDHPIKIQKHEIYFCEKIDKCAICNKRINHIISHYNSEHADVTYGAGSTWFASLTSAWKWCRVGVSFSGMLRNQNQIWCQYKLYEYDRFLVRVYTSLSGQQLVLRKCEIRLKNRSTGRVHTYTPDVEYNEKFDWHIDIGISVFPNWELGLDVVIKIT